MRVPGLLRRPCRLPSALRNGLGCPARAARVESRATITGAASGAASGARSESGLSTGRRARRQDSTTRAKLKGPALPRDVESTEQDTSTRADANPRHNILTLAIESSCDDACVALLERTGPASAVLRYNRRVTTDSRAYRGVHPISAAENMVRNLAPLVSEALALLPLTEAKTLADTGHVVIMRDAETGQPSLRRKPDFVSVTRGPGMTSQLSAGLTTAKGLAVAWQVPLVAINHMQAHALTPQLCSALANCDESNNKHGGGGSSHTTLATKLELEPEPEPELNPQFPFISLLVSGGHTLLVLTRGVTDHEVLAENHNIAVGDFLDKAARSILPAGYIERAEAAAGGSVAFGALLERFVFPGSTEAPMQKNGLRVYDYGYLPPEKRIDEAREYVPPPPETGAGYGWTLARPLPHTRRLEYNFSSLNGHIQKLGEEIAQRYGQAAADETAPAEASEAELAERRALGRAAMTVAFEHIVGRLVQELERRRDPYQATPEERAELPRIRAVVVSGGVASNGFLRRVLRDFLNVRKFHHVGVVAPPPHLCVDNAAMVAWAGAEMFAAGYDSELGVLPIYRWPLDARREGSLLAVDGWRWLGG